MTLSAETGATVEQVEKAMAELEVRYRARLAAIHQQALASNAANRRHYLRRRKLLQKYRNALVAEGPGGEGCDHVK